MIVPLSWLREFVRTQAAPRRLAEILTDVGIEVERVLDRRQAYERVVVGEVVEVKPHPNAERLRLAYVRVKAGGPALEIVCGAPNIAAGQKVPVALLGAKLPNGLTIEARKIRGVASNGMVCALDELGLGTDHSGIMVLDPGLPVGMPFAAAMGYDEVSLEIAVPANRGDVMSVRGLAREIAAASRISWKTPSVRVAESKRPVRRGLSIRIQSPKLCRRYVGRVVRGVSVRPSPAWLQRRLRAAGMRPINTVVDATNYVMLAYGQPLHAFDAAMISGGIVVRNARPGERLTTLDGVQRKLTADMLVIADVNGPVALAGVMGGAESEISDRTTDVTLESAAFDPVSIRRTSRRLGLVSEASKRFEKGLPIGLQDEAIDAAAAMIVALSGGSVDRGRVAAGSAIGKPAIVKLSSDVFGRTLGMPVPPARARSALVRLGFSVRGTAKSWTVGVPPWRLDVSLPADIVDEVGRSLGYREVPDVLPANASAPDPVPELVRLKDELRDLLVGYGFTETITHAFYGPSTARAIPSGAHIEVANPLDSSQQYLRRSLRPQLDRILEAAADRGDDVRIFEIGRVFLSTAKPIDRQQPWKLGIGVTLKLSKGAIPGRTVRGVAEALLSELGVQADTKIEVAVREVKGRTLEWCELDVAELRDRRVRREFRPLPAFPSSSRDIAVWTKPGVSYADLRAAIVQAGGELLESVELFDVFDRDNRRSLAFHMVFRAADRTLTDDQISAIMRAITEALRSLGAELR